MFIRICPILSVFIGFASTLFELEPFFFVAKAYIPDQMFHNHSFKIASIRLILSTICQFAFFWDVAFMYVIGTGMVDVILTIMGKLTCGKISFTLTFNVYSMLHLFLRSYQGFMDLGLFLFVTTLMGVTIISLYLSISAYSLILGSVFWIFPVVAVASVCFLEVLLVPFIYMCEESTMIILKLKIMPATIPNVLVGKYFNPRKLVRKRINTMRPFAWYAGLWDYRFHKFRKSTKRAIIERLSSFTVSALLAKRK